MVLVYSLALMCVMTALASMAVDYGRVQVTKTQLQAAADAAARAAVQQLPDQTAALSVAQAVAASNAADGASISLPTADVIFGNYASKTFTASGSPVNAVKITVRRTAATGNAVPLAFAGIYGAKSCNVTASAVCMGTSSAPRGFIGLGGISFKNNTFVGGYNSSTTTTPTHSSATGDASLSSNGSIDAKKNATVFGDLLLGPGASATGFTNSGGTQVGLSAAIATPADPVWAPVSNPNGISQNYTTSSSTTTLPGGTYWFTALTINGPLKFSGAATVYINGSVVIDDDLTAYQSIPANLKVYQLGTGRTFGDSKSNNIDIIADIVAPKSDFSVKNNLEFRGTAIFGTITAKNNADLYYDISEGAAVGGSTASLTQ